MKGSKYGTEIMTNEDCLLFAEVAIINGSDIKETVYDMRMIDNLMLSSRTYMLTASPVQRTRNGFLRKGHKLLDLFNSVIDARINQDKPTK